MIKKRPKGRWQDTIKKESLFYIYPAATTKHRNEYFLEANVDQFYHKPKITEPQLQ